MSDLIARGNFVFLKQDEVKTTTDGGLHLPSSVMQDPYAQCKATVVSVGPGYYLPDGKLIKSDLKVGDRVFFSPNVSKYIEFKYKEETTLFVDGVEKKTGGYERIHIVQEHDIFALIKED